MDARKKKDRPIAKERVAKKRQRRLNELLLKSLDDPDPLQANIGAASSDLMAMALRLKRLIDKDLSDDPNQSGRLKKILPALEIYLKVNRQVDRYVQLDRRLRPGQKDGGTRGPK